MDLDFTVEKAEVECRPRGTKSIVCAFLKSGKDFAEVVNIGDRKIGYIRSGIEQYVDRHCLPVLVITRRGRIFLMKEDKSC